MRAKLLPCGSFLIALFLLPALNAWAQQSTTLTVGTSNSFQIEFLGRTDDPGANTSTFSYRVTELTGKDLSNWTLALCMPLSNVLSWTPTKSDAGIQEVNIGTDPHTGIKGIKWNLADDFDNDGTAAGDSREFSVTLAGTWPVGPIDPDTGVGVKTGGGKMAVAIGTIDGPDCDLGECVPSNKPFWNGAFTGGVTVNNGAQDGHGFFPIDIPSGFSEIVLDLSESKNIGLTTIASTHDADGDGVIEGGEWTAVDESELIKSGPLTVSGGATAWTSIEYVGSQPLSNIAVFVSWLQQGSSRFMFKITDQCLFTGQLDPVVDLRVLPGEHAPLPERIELDQNYPNPFDSATRISFHLQESAQVQLVVYDLQGRQVKTLVSGQLGTGVHELLWDGTNASGALVPSGIYFYRLNAGDNTQIKQMTRLK